MYLLHQDLWREKGGGTVKMTLGEFTRRRNAGEDVHLTKSSTDAEMEMGAATPTMQPSTTGGDGTANSNGETSDRSSSGGSRSTSTPGEGKETEDTGCIAHSPSKRKTEEGHETSDTLVEEKRPITPALSHAPANKHDGQQMMAW